MQTSANNPAVVELLGLLRGGMGDADLARALLDGLRSAQRFETIFRAIPVGVAIGRLDDFQLVDVNPAWLEMNGFERQEIIGRTPVEIGNWCEPQAIPHYIARLRAEKRVVNVDVRQRRRDGEIRDRVISGEVFDLAGEPHALVLVIDVTERRRTERALLASESAWKQLSEGLPQIVWTTDRDGRFDYLGPQWVEYFGADMARRLRERADNPTHPDDRERFAEAWKRARRTEQPLDVRARQRGRDGRYRWFVVRAMPIRDADGVLQRWFGTSSDVHDVVLAEQALQESEARYRQLIESLPQLIWTTGPDGVPDYLSPQWYAYTGTGVDGLAESTWTRCQHPDDAARVAELWRGARDAGVPFDAELRLRAGDGTYRWFRAQARPMRDPGGQVVRWFGTSTNIHEIKLAEESLARQSETLESMVEQRTAELAAAVNRIRLLVDSSADGIYGLDTAGRITFANRAACAILGYEEQQLLGQDAHHLLQHRHADGQPYPADECPTRRTWQLGEPVRADDEVYWHAEGHAVPVAYAAHAIYADGRLQGAVVSFSDISLRRAAEEARDRALAEAQRLAEVRSEFLANMSHEIRTPLNAVLGFAQLGSIHSEDPHTRQMFTRIVDSGQLLLGVINDILDFTKIESGKLRIERRRVELARLLEHSVSVTREAAQAKGIEFRVERSPDAPRTFAGDELRIAQVLINLLSNAVKFTSRGEVVLTVAPRPGEIVFTVRDTGVGMTAEQLARAFEPFEQADGSMTRRYGGTGLGLAISKRLVALMSGEIHASSTPGQGSTFEVVLPLALDGLATGEFPPLRDLRAVPEHKQRLAGLRILAAEDNEANRVVLQYMLKAEGAQATFAGDGAELLRVLESQGEQSFDLVLMDVQMPVMDGYEAARRCRRRAPGLPILGVTAHAMAETRKRCVAAGMVAHLAKPIDLDKLVSAVLEFTRRRPGGGEEQPG